MAQSKKISLSLNKTSVRKPWIWKDINLEFTRGATNKVTTGTAKDVAAVGNAIHNLFMTNVGDRILLPQYGATLRPYLYEPVSQLTSYNIKVSIQNMFTTWLPRVAVQSIDVIPDAEHNYYMVEVAYNIPELKISDTYQLNLKGNQ